MSNIPNLDKMLKLYSKKDLWNRIQEKIIIIEEKDKRIDKLGKILNEKDQQIQNLQEQLKTNTKQICDKIRKFIEQKKVLQTDEGYSIHIPETYLVFEDDIINFLKKVEKGEADNVKADNN